MPLWKEILKELMGGGTLWRKVPSMLSKMPLWKSKFNKLKEWLEEGGCIPIPCKKNAPEEVIFKGLIEALYEW